MSRVPLFWKLAVDDASELRNWSAMGLRQVDRLHITLLYLGGKTTEQAAPLNSLAVDDMLLMEEALRNMDGRELTFHVTAILKHPDMIIARVALPDQVPCASSLPHLTLCRSPSVAPVFAQELLKFPERCDVSDVSPPLLMRGIIGLEIGSGERVGVFESNKTTTYEGPLLKVMTNPRPSRQTEPSGHATFHCEVDAQAWAAQLAASVKERPLGTEACKIKARLQAPGKPGHLYLKWGAVAGDMTADEIGASLEARLQELM